MLKKMPALFIWAYWERDYSIVETFEGETFTNIAVIESPTKVFSTKFGCAVSTYDRL